jgi:AcrR family transcriptional regulator
MASAADVIEAGVSAVRELGLDELSLRALAQRLGVTPMALYNHVEDAAALRRAVVAAVLARVPAVESKGLFAERARRWASAARPVLAEHPGVARHVLTHWFELEAPLDWVEALLAAAEAHGLRGFYAVAAVNALFTFVLMRVEAEEAVRRAGVVRRRLAIDRDPARWRRLKAHAREYEIARLDLHFEYGLETLLSGIERRRRRGDP